MEYVQKQQQFSPGRFVLSNQITNPTAALDLYDTAVTGATLVRQAIASSLFPTSHGFAYRLNHTASSANFTIGGDYGGMRLSMLPGHTYTVMGYYYQDTALSGTIGAMSRQIGIGVISPSNNGGAAYYLATTTQAPNTAATLTRLKTTFTIPGDATSAILRMIGGSSAGVSYWADLMIVEGNGLKSDALSLIDYFDGDTAANIDYVYSWSGSPHKSWSQRGLNTVLPDWTDNLNIDNLADAQAYVNARNAANDGYLYQVAQHCQA